MREREEVAGGSPCPERLPFPLPLVFHNPGRLLQEFSTRVLVIYLDSGSSRLPGGDRPAPHPLLLTLSLVLFSSPARQAWPCSRLLQMSGALLDIAGLQGTPESHFWGPSQPPNIL